MEMKTEIQKLGVASLSEATSLKECVSALVKAYGEMEMLNKTARAKWDEEMKKVGDASQQVLLLKKRMEKIVLAAEAGADKAVETSKQAEAASLVKERQEVVKEKQEVVKERQELMQEATG